MSSVCKEDGFVTESQDRCYLDVWGQGVLVSGAEWFCTWKSV